MDDSNYASSITNTLKKFDFNKVIFTLRFNWLSVNAILLTVLFCYFGYGSNQTLVIKCVFLMFPLIFYIGKESFSKFQDRISIKKLDIIILSLFFNLFLILGKEFIFRFPVGDEGAYSLIAFQTPISLIERIEILGPDFIISDGIRIFSVAAACMILLLLSLNSKIRPIPLILILTFSIVFSGTFFSAFGGVPAGYSKLNTLPLIFGGFLMGINGIALHLTMVTIFTIFIWAFWRTLISVVPGRSLFAFIVILGFATLSSTIYLSSLIDHSFYFIIFTSIPILNIFLGNQNNPERWVGLLSIGVFFRITVLIVLVCYLMFIFKRSVKSIWLIIGPSITIPYVLVFSATGNSGVVDRGSNQQVPSSLSELAFGFVNSAVLNLTWVNLAYFGIIILFAVVMDARIFVKLIIYFLLSYIVYFKFLNLAIVGNPKYQLEWFSTLLLCLFGYLVVRLKRSVLISIFLVLTIVSTLTNLWQNIAAPDKYVVFDSLNSSGNFKIDIISNQTFYLVNPHHDYQEILSQVPLQSRERCLVTGTTYGQILEIMAGRSRSEIANLKTIKGNFVQSQLLGKTKVPRSEFDDALKVGADCIITTTLPSAKRDVSFSQWSLEFVSKDNQFRDTLRIFLRQ